MCPPVRYRPTLLKGTAPFSGIRRRSVLARFRSQSGRTWIHLRQSGHCGCSGSSRRQVSGASLRVRYPRPSRIHAAQVRNDGSRGIASMAISALDIALWDLKAKLFGCSLIDLFGSSSCKRRRVRQRRIHDLQRPAVDRAVLWLGRRRIEERKDEDWRGAGRRSSESPRGPRSDRAIHQSFCRCERRLRCAAGDCLC